MIKTMESQTGSNFDSCNAQVENAVAAFARCTDATSADSALFYYTVSWFYFYNSVYDKTDFHSAIAYRILHQGATAADSVRNEMIALRSFFLTEDELRDSATVMRLQEDCESYRQAYATAVAQRWWLAAEIRRSYGDMDSVAMLSRRLLEMANEVPPTQQWMMASALHTLGREESERGNLRVADSLLTRARAIYEALGEGRITRLAWCLSDLATVYTRQGRYFDNIQLSRRAIAILESLPPEQQHDLSYAYHTLGNSYIMFRQFTQAEECYRKAATLAPQVLPPDDVTIYAPLVGLGDLRLYQRRFDEAESTYQDVLSKVTARWGAETFAASELYRSLGNVCLATGRATEAEQMYRHVLDIWKKGGGMSDNEFAGIYMSMARAVAMQDRCSEARIMLADAERRLDNTSGRNFFRYRTLLRNIAAVHRCLQQYDSSMVCFDRLLVAERDFMELSFPHLTEGQRLQWLSGMLPVHSDLLLLAMEINQPRYSAAAFQMNANDKGRVIEASLVERRILTCSTDQQVERWLDEYKQVSSQLANLAYLRMTRGSSGTPQPRISELSAHRDSLELRLTRACASVAGLLRQRYVEGPQIFQRIGPGALLWDVVRVRPQDMATQTAAYASDSNDHYVVFVCDSGGVKSLHDAGPAAELDSLVALLRHEVGKADQVYSTFASRHETELRRIAARIAGRLPSLPPCDSASPRTLYLSPEGTLGLLPFEILPLDSNRYFIDSYRINYLASARDLTDEESPVAASPQALILAAPAYDQSISDTASFGLIVDPPQSNQSTAGEDLASCFGNGFMPLPQADKEADSIAALLVLSDIPTTILSGPKASESSVRSRTDQPSIVHFATHGFFCERVDSTSLASLRSPMLRSGLALAGANRTLKGAEQVSQDDGILTAYEVSAMDFTGTELVVLSACETGAGDISRSDGVLGLTRAFRQAGARSVIMNLWRVSDNTARTLMTEFYRQWTGGKSKAEALRQAMLKAKARAKARYGHTHPYLWCGFVLIGEAK